MGVRQRRRLDSILVLRGFLLPNAQHGGHCATATDNNWLLPSSSEDHEMALLFALCSPFDFYHDIVPVHPLSARDGSAA